jgi:hypothetical protein
MGKVVKLKNRTNGRSAVQAAKSVDRPARSVAEDAVRTLIRWSGDDPEREGLTGTPARVVRAYEDWFSGYFEDPREYLKRTFEEVAGYDEIVVLRDIRFESHCEHPYRADHRPRSHWLSSAQSSDRNFEVGSSRRRLRKTASGSRKNDRRDCRLSEQRLEALRSRRCRRGCPSVHDDKRRAQIGRDNGDQLYVGQLQDAAGNAAGVSVRN